MTRTTFNVSIVATSIAQINSSLNFEVVEAVFAATGKHTNICLLKGKGNAYISKVELRPLNDSIYFKGNSSSVLKLISRVDLGNKNFSYRYSFIYIGILLSPKEFFFYLNSLLLLLLPIM